MPHVKTKTIYILLTKHSDHFSKLFQTITAGEYTHASIGMEEYGNEFFSFVTKGGFRVERPVHITRAKKGWRSCALYRLDVPEEAYWIVRDRIEEFKRHAKQYRFSFLGVALCYLRIPHQLKNSYFCSQFVSELITSSGAAKLRKQPSLYRPDDFIREPQLRLCFQGTLGGLSKVF